MKLATKIFTGFTGLTTSIFMAINPVRAEILQGFRPNNMPEKTEQLQALPPAPTPAQLAQVSPECLQAKSDLEQITLSINQLRQVEIPQAKNEADTAEQVLRQTPKTDPNYQSLFNAFTVANLNLNSLESQYAVRLSALPLAVNGVRQACD